MPFSAGLYRTISYQNASSKPEQSLISSSLSIASCCFVCSESCCVSYYIFETLFVLYICNFSYYIFATFRIIYIRHFSYYIFATFRIIYLQLFILYFCNFSYYIFDTFRIIYLQLRIIKFHFRIIKLGYVLKIYVRIVNNRFVFFSLLARHKKFMFVL